MSAMPAVEFETEVLSEAGGRRENQDCAGWRRAGEFSCWVLADGLGGHHGGAVAAGLAVDGALEAFAAQPGCSPEVVRGCLGAADLAVRRGQRQNPVLKSMNSTAVVLIAGPASSVWGHIGDTRLYCLHSGRIARQTRDHSVPQALADRQEITPGQIRFHEDHSLLLRSLGSGESFRPSVLEAAQPLLPGTAFLLCTDGFWEYVTEDAMETDLASSETPRDWLARMRARLVRTVPPDHDNYSAIAVFTRSARQSSAHCS